jgi:hypothetical protein
LAAFFAASPASLIFSLIVLAIVILLKDSRRESTLPGLSARLPPWAKKVADGLFNRKPFSLLHLTNG